LAKFSPALIGAGDDVVASALVGAGDDVVASALVGAGDDVVASLSSSVVVVDSSVVVVVGLVEDVSKSASHSTPLLNHDPSSLTRTLHGLYLLHTAIG